MKMHSLNRIFVIVLSACCHWVFSNPNIPVESITSIGETEDGHHLDEMADVISSLQEQDLVDEEEAEENPTERTKPRKSPSEYVNFLLAALDESTLSPLPRAERSPIPTRLDGKPQRSHRERLFLAWTSADGKVDIDEDNKTTVIFQQNLPLDSHGEFTSSEITLTQRKDAAVTSNAFLNMYAHLQDDTHQVQRKLVRAMPILPGKRFYSFPITDFISSSLQANLSTPNFIRITFLLSAIPHGHGGQTFDFGRNFDLQVELPTIYFYYRGFLPPADIKTFHNIRKRSVRTNATRPSSLCQRRELLVDPAHIGWSEIIQPKKLDLGFCSGTCPFPLQGSDYNFTLHSFLLDRYRMQHTFEDLPTGYPLTTCIPVRYKSLSIIEIFGSADVYQASVVENMSVDICGCR